MVKQALVNTTNPLLIGTCRDLRNHVEVLARPCNIVLLYMISAKVKLGTATKAMHPSNQ